MIPGLQECAIALSSVEVGESTLAIALIVLALLFLLRTRERHSPRSPREAAETEVSEVRYHVPGMACQNCAQSIDAALRTIPGVLSVKSMVRHQRVHVRYVPAQVHEQEIREAFGRAGYDAAELESPRSENKST